MTKFDDDIDRYNKHTLQRGENMPTGVEECLRDDGFVAELFSKEYRKMVRYATVVFQKRGGYVDPVGRAEDIVQETFLRYINRYGQNGGYNMKLMYTTRNSSQYPVII